MKEKFRKYLPYLVSIAIALAVGGLSAKLTSGKMEEYEKLIQPPLAPPSWAFPVVWSILYVLMGISSARVLLQPVKEKSDALFVYAAQLIVNLLWTLFYFGFNARLLAFFWLLFLLILVLLMVSRFHRIDKLAGKLQIPYVIWLVYAGYLNLATYLLNK